MKSGANKASPPKKKGTNQAATRPQSSARDGQNERRQKALVAVAEPNIVSDADTDDLGRLSDDELVAYIKREQSELGVVVMRAVCANGGVHAFRIGRALLVMKSRIGHGRWLNWCRDNLGFGARMARIYMGIARMGPEGLAKAAEHTNGKQIADLTIRDLMGEAQQPGTRGQHKFKHRERDEAQERQRDAGWKINKVIELIDWLIEHALREFDDSLLPELRRRIDEAERRKRVARTETENETSEVES